jgi:hypothetical protein
MDDYEEQRRQQVRVIVANVLRPAAMLMAVADAVHDAVEGTRLPELGIAGAMECGERLKLRHKVTGQEEGPFREPTTRIRLWLTQEYDFIRSSNCDDRHGNEIFVDDMVSLYRDACPVQIVVREGRVGYFDEGGMLVDVTPEWSVIAEIVGRDGVVVNW